MKYKVVITAPANVEIAEAYAWLCDEIPLHASEWHAGLVAAIGSLETFPFRCAVAPESSSAETDIRQLLYGISSARISSAFYCWHRFGFYLACSTRGSGQWLNLNAKRSGRMSKHHPRLLQFSSFG